jgi:hypothetical protein
VKIIWKEAGLIFNPKAVCDKNNNLHLVWWSSNKIPINNTGAFYSYYDGNRWSIPEKIFDDVRTQDISIDDNGFLHIAMEVFKSLPNKNLSLFHSISVGSVYKINKE